jgi:apolipoprotein N-acyltransferase
VLYQLIAALLYAASFKPLGFWLAAPIAVAIQIYALRKFKHPEVQAFCFAFLSSLVILSWSRVFVGVTPWLFLALLQGLLAVPIGITARFTKNIPTLVFSILLLEEIRARFPFGGFSWTRIAFSQVDSPISPLVAIFGMAGLSALTLLISVALLTRSYKIFAIVILLAFVAPFTLRDEKGNQSIQVLAVQGGVPERGLEFNARAQEVLDNHIAQTRRSFSRSDDVIIWPENSIDIDPIANDDVAGKIMRLTAELDRPLLAGAILDSPRLVNATILFNKQGSPTSVYLKRFLTPFGEYIPLRGIAAKVSSHVNRVEDFTPGNDLVLHRVSGAVIASVICYEILNDGLIREAASESNFLSVHTNSATFSGSNEGEQQLAITRLRAIESGRSIVSISTTGPSAIIDRRGEVLLKLADGDVGSLSTAIELHEGRTMAHRLGGFTTLSVLLLVLGWALISRRRGVN